MKWVNVTNVDGTFNLPKEGEYVVIDKGICGGKYHDYNVARVKKCDVSGNNIVPFMWKANGGPMAWFGQEIKRWARIEEAEEWLEPVKENKNE